MSPLYYKYLRKLLRDHSGLDLPADRHYSVVCRLLTLRRNSGLGSISELVKKTQDGAGAYVAQVAEAMTTNETCFFRDKIAFDHFRNAIIPEMLHDFSSLGRFDVIFYRNILICFDHATKSNIYRRLARIIDPNGFLLPGAAETIVGWTDAFNPLHEGHGVYHPNEAVALPARTGDLAGG